MTEKSGRWQRVSTSGQDEASQLPDLVRWEESHGYENAAEYVLHGKSASKGQQDRYLDQVIRDMEDGKITVLVVWQSSRIERRGAYSVFDLARRVREAGGRIEFVKDNFLNEANEMSDVMLALAATRDRQKSRDISLQVTAKHDSLRAAGSVVGRPAWGYRIVELDGRKVFAPTEEGRKYVPQIFDKVIDGASLRDIAAWLTAEGIATDTGGKTWHEGYLGNRLIKNPVYRGQRRNAGMLETEALVSATTWKAAQLALASRAKPGRAATVNAKPMLRPVCGVCFGQKRPGCQNGCSSMYRVFTGNGRNRVAYYRCSGSGPQRKGCGAPMIRCDELDQAVTFRMTHDPHPHTTREFVPGDDAEDQITALRLKLDKAQTRAESNSLWDEIERLENADRKPAHWVERETGITRGQHFRSLDDDARRAYMAGWHPVAGPRDADGDIIIRMDAFQFERSTNFAL